MILCLLYVLIGECLEIWLVARCHLIIFDWMDCSWYVPATGELQGCSTITCLMQLPSKYDGSIVNILKSLLQTNGIFARICFCTNIFSVQLIIWRKANKMAFSKKKSNSHFQLHEDKIVYKINFSTRKHNLNNIDKFFFI